MSDLFKSLESQGDLGSALGGLGGAAQDLFGAAGSFAESKSYKRAAGLSEQNAEITRASTRIQQTQAQREIFQTIGGQQAQVGSAGFASSGSALDLMRSSASQGALTKSLIQAQGTINANGYESEAESYRSMSKASKAAGISGIIGGITKGVGALASAGFI